MMGAINQIVARQVEADRQRAAERQRMARSSITGPAARERQRARVLRSLLLRPGAE